VKYSDYSFSVLKNESFTSYIFSLFFLSFCLFAEHPQNSIGIHNECPFTPDLSSTKLINETEIWNVGKDSILLHATEQKNRIAPTFWRGFEKITFHSNSKLINDEYGVVIADIDNDADLDLFITNRRASNRLYINDGMGISSDKTERFIGLDSAKSSCSKEY